MKKFLGLFFILLTSLQAFAVNCEFKTPGGNYWITLQEESVDVTTNGAGWLMELDKQQSSAEVKYYRYEYLVFIYQNNQVGLYDYNQKDYYFSNINCKLPIVEKLPPPPPFFQPDQYQDGHHNQHNNGGAGAVGLPGGQFTPLPSGSSGLYKEDIHEPFTVKRVIKSPSQNGIACDDGGLNQPYYCETNRYYLIIYENRVELTMKSNGTQYMFPALNAHCDLGGFCEQMYGFNTTGLRVGRGSTDGIQLYIAGDGPLQFFSFEFPHDW